MIYMKNFDHVKRQLVKCAPVLLASAFVFYAATPVTDITSACQGETNCDTNESEMKLFGAIAAGDSKKAESLLAEGVNPYARIEISAGGEKSCSSALMQAFLKGQKEIVGLLLRAIGRNTRHGYWEDRHNYARFRCEESIIRPLVTSGIGINTIDLYGHSPLAWAASCGSVELTRYLIENGADVNRIGNAAIMKTLDSYSPGDLNIGNKAKIIGILVHAGADINSTDHEGNTALMLAAGKAIYFDGPNPLVTELLSLGANVNSTNKHGDTALIKAVKRLNDGYGQYAYERGVKGIAETINGLVSAGADTNAENHYGETALKILSTRSGTEDLNLLKVLLTQNVDINKIGSTREPALILAIRSAAGRSNSDMVRALIKAGADVNARDYAGSPALIVAIRESGNSDVVSLLLGAGARVNDKDLNGDTALIAAVREHLPTGDVAVKKALRRNLEVIRTLLTSRADISAKDERGYTAIDLAKQANNEVIIQLLSEANKDRK